MIEAAWTIIEKTPGRKWLCRCSCGTERMVNRNDLRAGKSRNCGCTRFAVMREAQRKAVTTHGMDGTPTYRSWVDMKRRCYSPQRPDYHRYGGRGITVCAAWLDSFEAFHADMGDRPEGKTIDRIDNDKPYEPGNCKWSTRQEQGRNTRVNHLVVVGGKKMTVAEASELYGIKPATALSRLQRGWSDERTFLQPLRGH